MKVNLTLLITIMILSIFLCSCQSNSPNVYQSHIFDIANDGILQQVESDYWNGNYWQENSLKATEHSISFYDKSYSGVYRKSLNELYNSFTSDFYKDPSGIEFAIRRDNGKLVYLNFMTKAFFDTEPYLADVSNPEVTALELATDAAAYFLQNLESYSIITHDPTVSIKEKNGITYSITYYNYTFAKELQGYKTSDFISVRVSSKGHIASIYIGDIDAFDGTNITIDSDSLNNSISSKIENIYSQTPYTVVEYSIVEQIIAKAPDEHLCICSSIAVKLIDNGNTEFSTGVRVLTILE